MSDQTTPTTESRLERLGLLIQLQFEARHAATLDELFFHMVNNTHHILAYRQAIIWSTGSGGRGRVAAVSGLPQFDPNSPYIAYLSKVLAHISSSGAQGVTSIVPDDLPPSLRDQWSEWLPAKAAWIPMIGSKGGMLGGIFLSRDDAWSEDDEYLLAQIVDAYAVAWVHFIARRSLPSSFARWVFNRKFAWMALAAIVAAMFIPMSQSVLAPGEIIAKSPALARAHMKGVVNNVYVQPNEAVLEGQLLFDLEATDLRNQLRVAALTLEVTRAEYRQVAQKAVYDAKSKARVQLLNGRIKVQTAKVKRFRDQLKLIEVRAAQSGVAIFGDINDWIGRPVIAGEKIMQIADPSSVELEAALPVSDAINFQTGAKVLFFLNVDPENALAGRVGFSSFRARVTPDGVLAYRVTAILDDAANPPRIGLRGTAKIYGEATNLFYFLFRRPLAKTRQWLGL